MNANAKLAKIMALCTTLVILAWHLGATSAISGVPQLISKSFDAARTSSPNQAGKHTSNDPSSDASQNPENLGQNGRPNLPFQNFATEHAPTPSDDGSHLSDTQIQEYTNSILDLGDTKFWRMECRDQEHPGPRYEVLRTLAASSPGIKYYFALDLYQSIHILPRLLSTIIQTIKYLGPSSCALSIIEGRSTDGTYLILHALRQHLSDLGITYHLAQSAIDPHAENTDRIEQLSLLRNMALAPLTNPSPDSPLQLSEKPFIFFINDIALCPSDTLELLYQHALQNATQTCALDWVDGGNLFYDVWVSRSLSGNTFFEIPQDMTWAFSRNMFWDEPVAHARYAKQLPFQVFSCWGGMTVLDAQPFVDGQIAFRRNYEEAGECYGGEPQTLASDLAKLGLNRVQTVPYVAVAYSDHEGALAKEKHGYVHQHVDVAARVERADFSDDEATDRITWKAPPPRFRCMPSFVDSWWVDSVFEAPADE